MTDQPTETTTRAEAPAQGAERPAELARTVAEAAPAAAAALEGGDQEAPAATGRGEDAPEEAQVAVTPLDPSAEAPQTEGRAGRGVDGADGAEDASTGAATGGERSAGREEAPTEAPADAAGAHGAAPPADEGAPPADVAAPETAGPADAHEPAPPADEGAPEADQAAPEADQAAPEADQAAAEADQAAAEADDAAPEADQAAPEADQAAPEADDAAPLTAEAEAAPARPGPRPGPKGRRPRPHAPSVRPAVRPPSDPTPWGRMAEDGVVYVRTADGERVVGTVVDATEEAALAHYGREFDALVAQVDLAEQRLMAGEVSPGEVVGQLRALRGSLGEVLAVGDLEGLAQRTRDLEAVAATRRAEADAARAAAREEALAARTALVEEAERIAATDADRVQWRPSGDRLRELLDAWKEAQRTARLDKRTEDDLWKRFSAARTSFDRARRAWFSQLEERNSEAKGTKEGIVREAESLATSTAWGPTSTAYRQLMDRWRAAGRGAKKDDDALWVRFRAAQDTFFAARTAANAEEDEEQKDNLVVKEALLVEAERLVPVQDFRAARAALRGIQERWEAAGRVPRADLQRVERRLRAVEQAVTDAERERWRRSNPETRARATGAVEQLERAVAGLQADLDRARERGDARGEEQARAALEARQAWLDAARRTAEEFSG